jgi:hypothetical protein
MAAVICTVLITVVASYLYSTHHRSCIHLYSTYHSGLPATCSQEATIRYFLVLLTYREMRLRRFKVLPKQMISGHFYIKAQLFNYVFGSIIRLPWGWNPQEIDMNHFFVGQKEGGILSRPRTGPIHQPGWLPINWTVHITVATYRLYIIHHSSCLQPVHITAALQPAARYR